ncbi:MAG: nucleotidyltransferase [Aestuariivirga sp.]|nr:nucleotidyltransferase [Aestuariivirga sp.]
MLPSLITWGGQYIESVAPSGSFAKGTAIRGSTDIDFFVSLSQSTPNTLKEVYETLFNRFKSDGFVPRKQNVSIGVNVGGYSVDVVPAKRQNNLTSDHSLFKNRAGTWTKTNVGTHIRNVTNSGRQEEIIVMKVWAKQNAVFTPSFLLELLTMEACENRPIGSLSRNVSACFDYVRDNVVSIRCLDPSNSENVVSDDLTVDQKKHLAKLAGVARNKQFWVDVVK